MVTAFKLLLSFLPVLGIMLFLSRCKLKIQANFLPAAACAGITLVLFFSSLLSIFGIAATLLHIFGLCYVLWYLILTIQKKQSLKSIFSPALVFFIFGSLLCVFLLRNAIYRAPDVYTHWGRMVKEVLSFDGLPTPFSTIGENRAYTPGMALFIAFFLRNVGYSNSLAIVCQAIMAVALMSAVFIGSGFKRPLGLVIRALALLLCMGGFTSTFNDLMIDYVVSLSGAAMLIAIYTYWNDQKNQNIYSLLALMPLVTLPVLLKTSGIIYSLLGIALICLLYFMQRPKTALLPIKSYVKYAFIGLTPIISFILWNAYVAHAWQNAPANAVKFSLNFDAMLSIYNSKSPEMRAEVILNSLSAIIFEKHNLYFFVPLIMLLAIVLILKPQSKKTDIIHIASGAIAWTLFNIGYILMMLFLMPAREVAWDSTLAYSRYVGTITVSLGLFYLWCFAGHFAALHARMGKARFYTACAGCAAVLCAFIAPLWNNTFWGFTRQDEASKQFLAIESVGAQVNGMFGRTDKLLIYNADYLEDSTLYNGNTYACVFLNTNTMHLSNTTLDGGSLSSLPDKIAYAVRNNDYLIVACPCDEFEGLLLSQGVTMDSPDGIIYKINKDIASGELSLLKLK